MTRVRPTLGLLTGAIMVLSACGSGAAGPTTGASTPGASASVTGVPEPAAVNLGVDWTYETSFHPGFVMADEQGYYEDAGLDPTFQYYQGSNPLLAAVAAGTVDIAVLAGPEAILSGLDKGLPLTVVANPLQINASGVIARKGSGILDFADLAGHSISTAAASPESALLTAALAHAGLDPAGDVQIQSVDPQVKCTLTISGQTDACTGFSNHQVEQFRAEGIDVEFLAFSTPERPILGHSTVVNADFLRENPQLVEAFLRASYEGWQAFVTADIDEVVGMYKARRPETDEKFLAATLEVTRAQLLFSDRTEEHGWGWMTDDVWENLGTALLDAGIIGRSIPTAEIYTNDLLPETADFSKP